MLPYVRQPTTPHRNRRVDDFRPCHGQVVRPIHRYSVFGSELSGYARYDRHDAISLPLPCPQYRLPLVHTALRAPLRVDLLGVVLPTNPVPHRPARHASRRIPPWVRPRKLFIVTKSPLSPLSGTNHVRSATLPTGPPTSAASAGLRRLLRTANVGAAPESREDSGWRTQASTGRVRSTGCAGRRRRAPPRRHRSSRHFRTWASLTVTYGASVIPSRMVWAMSSSVTRRLISAGDLSLASISAQNRIPNRRVIASIGPSARIRSRVSANCRTVNVRSSTSPTRVPSATTRYCCPHDGQDTSPRAIINDAISGVFPPQEQSHAALFRAPKQLHHRARSDAA